MSGARRVAGVRPRTGRRLCAEEDPCVSKKETAQLRAAFHDYVREHGGAVKPARKPCFGNGAAYEGAAPRNARREDWRARFLLAYERSGNPAHAANMVGSSEMQVDAELAANPSFAEDCSAALGRHVWRLACRAVQKRTRLELPARQIAAFMGHVQALLKVANEHGVRTKPDRARAAAKA